MGHDIATVVAAVLAALGESDPAESAPAAPVAAAPFAVYGANGTPEARVLGSPDPRVQAAVAAAPDGDRMAAARYAAAYHRIPGYACDAEVRLIVPGGNVAEGRTVGHGQIRKRDSGAECPTNGCTGKII